MFNSIKGGTASGQLQDLMFLLLFMISACLAADPTLVIIKFSRTSVYDPNLHMSEECMDYCDKHRRLGWREDFELQCDQVYLTRRDRDLCRSNCTKCPDSVCDKKQPQIFHCPAVELTGSCGQQCDDARTRRNFGGFVFNCSDVYSNPKSLKKCHQSAQGCPSWVTDPSLPYLMRDTLYCPSLYLEKFSPCYEACENHREQFGKGGNAYYYSCKNLTSPVVCKARCKSCPKSICDSNSNLESEDYYCPPVPIPKPDLPPAVKSPERVYEGICKQRCDEFRSGAPSNYTFQCEKLFKSEPEQIQCLEDCRQCPPNTCDVVDYEKSGIFQCPSPFTNSRTSTSGSEKAAKKKGLSTLIAALSIAGVVTFICIGVTIFCYIRRRKLKRAAAVTPAAPEPSEPSTTTTIPKPTPSSSEPASVASMAPVPISSNVPAKKEEGSKSPAAVRVSGQETASVVPKVKDPKRRSRQKHQTKT